jgi:enediyne biosynthesis protein E4
MQLRKVLLIIGANLLLLSALLPLSSGQSAKPQPRPAGVQFNKIAESGITFRHENGASAEKHMFETFGSGVGVIDFDNDGQPDLFFANGANLAQGKPSPGNALYRNLGNGRFEDVTATAGVAGNKMFATGVTVGDYDNDGYLDIYVTGYGAINSFATMATRPLVR